MALIDLIKADHEDFKMRFPLVLDATGDERKQRFDSLMHDLVRHEVAEEEIVWPEVRKALADGDALADERIAEESKAEESLKKLDDLDVMSAEFEDIFATLQMAVVKHAEAEEQKVLTRLAAQELPEDLETLGEWWERAKAMAPTFPHPKTPNTATANIVGGPILSLVDHLREKVRSAQH